MEISGEPSSYWVPASGSIYLQHDDGLAPVISIDSDDYDAYFEENEELVRVEIYTPIAGKTHNGESHFDRYVMNITFADAEALAAELLRFVEVGRESIKAHPIE